MDTIFILLIAHCISVIICLFLIKKAKRINKQKNLVYDIAFLYVNSVIPVLNIYITTSVLYNVSHDRAKSAEELAEYKRQQQRHEPGGNGWEM